MSKRARMHPVYVLFLAIMILMALCGLFLLIYGSMHHEPAIPLLQGSPLFATQEALCHG